MLFEFVEQRREAMKFSKMEVDLTKTNDTKEFSAEKEGEWKILVMID